MNDYLKFLRQKIVQAPVAGFHIDPSEVNPALKPHQRDAVVWAVAGGRRALFESFGLGKTIQELEWCHIIIRHEGGQALISYKRGGDLIVEDVKSRATKTRVYEIKRKLMLERFGITIREVTGNE